MKKLTLIGLIAILALGIAWIAYAQDAQGSGESATVAAEATDTPAVEEAHVCGFYYCPMFCDNFMTQDKEAKCPICGMDVVGAEYVYACPMCSSSLTANPDAVCETCGMDLEPVDALYVCPNHPTEYALDPMVKCPECDSELVLVKIGPQCCSWDAELGDITGCPNAAAGCSGESEEGTTENETEGEETGGCPHSGEEGGCGGCSGHAG
jgi:hypothetical protein